MKTTLSLVLTTIITSCGGGGDSADPPGEDAPPGATTDWSVSMPDPTQEIAISSTGHIALVNRGDNGFGNEGRITQLNPQGGIDFSIGFNGFRPEQVTVSPGGYVYAANANKIIVADDAGNIGWTREVSTNQGIFDIAASADGVFLLTGNLMFNQQYLYYIDEQSGTEIWSRALVDGEGDPDWRSIRANNVDNGVILIGTESVSESPQVLGVAIASIDSFGDLRWLNVFSDTNLGAIEDIWLRRPDACLLNGSGDIIVSANYDDALISFITRLDSASGNVVWTKGYKTAGELTEVTSLSSFSNGTFGGCLQIEEETGPDDFIMSSCFVRFDGSGNILSAYGFDTTQESEFGFAHPHETSSGYSLLGFNSFENWEEQSSMDINGFSFNSSGAPTFPTCASSKNYASLVTPEARSVDESGWLWTIQSRSWDVSTSTKSLVTATQPSLTSICDTITF
ncbi:hypothetical protein OAV41_02580 [Planctomycetota bacterium]|nr:hypothetical protein [Planctomycetota bacterium]